MFVKIYRLLCFTDTKHRRLGYLALLLSLVAATLDAVGVASVLPMVALITSSDSEEVIGSLQLISATLGVDISYFSLTNISILLCLVFVSAMASKAISVALLMRFCYTAECLIGTRLLGDFLNLDLSEFKKSDSNRLAQNTLSELNVLLVNAILPIFLFTTHAICVILILCVLLMLDPVRSSAVFGVLGGALLVVFVILQPFVAGASLQRLRANGMRFETIRDILANFALVKFYNCQDQVLKKFLDASRENAQANIVASLAGQLPRFLVEAIGFSCLIGYLVISIDKTGENDVLPFVATLAFAAYRMLPSMQHVYNNYTNMRYSKASVEQMLERLESRANEVAPIHCKILTEISQCLLEVKNLCFQYGDKCVLTDLNFTVFKNEIVAICGESGAGKSTLINCILGLLPTKQGGINFYVGGTHLSENIGYVPQDLEMVGDNLDEIFSFVGRYSYDIDRAGTLLRDLGLSDLATGENWQFKSYGVGVRRLSGGQRQRVALVRALLREPKLLVIDEPSSALDEKSKRRFLDLVIELKPMTSFLLITHDVEVMQSADHIHILERGKLYPYAHSE